MRNKTGQHRSGPVTRETPALHFYISGALTGTDEPERLKRLYRDLADVCVERGHTAYVPHEHTDPILHADIPPAEVYARDRAQLEGADAVIAYVGVASFGVGMEIEIAHQRSVPVIILCEKGRTVTRMVRGNPAVRAEIVFVDRAEAKAKLSAALERIEDRDEVGDGRKAEMV